MQPTIFDLKSFTNMISLTEIFSNLFDIESRLDSFYDDFLRMLSMEYGYDIIDDKIKNWVDMNWNDFYAYLLNKGIDLENSTRNWKRLFETQKENFLVLQHMR